MTHIHTRVHRSHVAGMHVMLFLLRKYQLCSNVVTPGKLRVGLKISDKLCARNIPTCTFTSLILPEAFMALFANRLRSFNDEYMHVWTIYLLTCCSYLFIVCSVFYQDISWRGILPSKVLRFPPTTSPLPCSEDRHFRLSDCDFSFIY